jgi:hypothetical protein
MTFPMVSIGAMVVLLIRGSWLRRKLTGISENFIQDQRQPNASPLQLLVDHWPGGIRIPLVQLRRRPRGWPRFLPQSPPAYCSEKSATAFSLQ